MRGALCEVRYCTDMPDIMLTAASVAPAPIRSVQDVFEAVVAWLDSFSSLVFVLVLFAVWLTVRSIWRSMKSTLPGVKAAIKFVEAQFTLPEFMDDMREQVREIRHEVLPNNGRSLRDDLETVTLMVEKHGIEIAQLTEHDKAGCERLGVLENTINRRREQRAIIQQEADSGSADIFPTDVSEE